MKDISILDDTYLKSEHDIIQELKKMFTSQKGRVGIGDDAAFVEKNLLISTDACVEGVHFLRGKASWDEVAYKLFASNASDIAAMGGSVLGYTLALSLPAYWNNIYLSSFLSGIRDFLKEFPADLLGGDVVRTQEFFASVTVLGEVKKRPWLRSTAQEGDFLYCTGTIGDSKFWLNKELGKLSLPLQDAEYFRKRHYKPEPRLSYVEKLSAFSISSAIDISDGLIEDVEKLCDASCKSFYIDGDALPLSLDKIGLNNFQQHKIQYQKEALVGGEDYELVVTSPEDINVELLLLQGIYLTKIGQILTKTDSSFVLLNNEKYLPSEFVGYRHS